MTTGDFNGDGEEDVAVGMPRGERLLGKIVLFKWNAVNQLNITGRQIGAYFGYSVCAVDVDGDKLDDLIIGAPMFTIPNNKGEYDVGRVYIMLQGANAKFEKYQTRDGKKSKGRFGLSLTTLGDINQDGYGDFAVGAPYDGTEGRGAVYIFHGSKNGPLPEASQIIYAEDVIGAPYPRTFGFALAGGMDMDGNLYPDLAVGAYESDSVLVFKSRPVVVVVASTKFITDNEKMLNLDDKRCTTRRDGKKVTCIDIESCLTYNGKNLPPVLDFEVSWILDIKKFKTPRMYFMSDQADNVRNSTIQLERGKKLCHKETVFIVDNIRDKLTALEVEMKYQLRGSKSKPVVRTKRDILEPVIDQNRDTFERAAIHIQKNCGSDNKCVPDLRLEITTVDKFLLGSKAPLVIEVLVSNFGEDAFEASFYMVMPEELDFNKIQQIGDARDSPITCTAINYNSASNYTLKCDIGNPLPAGKVAHFKVLMDPLQKSGMSPSYEFYMEANSTNLEKEGSHFDNIVKKSVNIWIETDLEIQGVATPEFDHYKASDYKSYLNATYEKDLGPQVMHMYNIRNNGPSFIEAVEVYIHWPYKTENGDTLMYMLQKPYTHGKVECEQSIHVNPRNIILDSNLENKNYLEFVIGKQNEATTNYQTGVRIDKSSSQSTTFNHETGIRNRNVTESERRKLDDEANIDSAGDASLIHIQRAQEAAVAGSHGSYGGQTTYTTNAWNSSNTYDRIPIGMTTIRNRTVTIDNQGNVVESSTKYYTNVDRDMNAARTYNAENRGYSSGGYNSGSYGHGSTHNDYNYGGSSGASNQYNDFALNLDKIAQDGHGLHVGTLGLDTLGSRNTDDELIKYRNNGNSDGSSQSHSFSSQSRYQDENANFESNPNRVISGDGRISGSSGQYIDDKYHGGDLSNAYDNTNKNYESHHSSSQTHKFSSHGNRENIGEYNRRDYRREKRNLNINNGLTYDTPCKSENCGTLRCVVKDLGNNDGAWIAVRARLVAATMKHLSENIPLNISTMAIARVIRLPYIGTPKDNLFKSHQIFYKAIPEPIPSSDMVPLWVVVLSACAGVIILLLLVYLLYKCGFFKRNRPSDNLQERQPLNSRNGYHGDEHL